MTKNHNRSLAGAIIQRDADGAIEAIRMGAHPDAIIDGTRPLHVATIAGSRDMVELLIRNGADPNARDSLGRTALHWAAIGAPEADPHLIPSLLQAGAQVNARDEHQCTPLDLAAGAQNRSAAEALAAAGGECRADRRTWVQAVSGPASGDGPSSGGRSR